MSENSPHHWSPSRPGSAAAPPSASPAPGMMTPIPPPPLPPLPGTGTAARAGGYSEPPGTAPGAPVGRSRKGWLIAVIVAAVVLALVIAVAGVFVVTRLLGDTSGSGSALTVESIREKPDAAWTYSYQGRGEETDVSGLVPVGEEDFAGIFLSTGESMPSRVAMVDGETGEETWSVPLDTLGVDEMAWPQLLPVSPEGHLTIADGAYAFDSAGELDWDASQLHLIALDPSDGRVVSETRRQGHAVVTPESMEAASWIPSTGPEAVVVKRSGGLVRLDTSDLDGEPVWSTNVEDVDTTEIVGDFVRVDTTGTERWLDAETGDEPSWFVGEGEGVMFLPTFDSMILRFEYTESGTIYLDGLDHDGTVLWSAEPDRFHDVASPQGRMLFFSENDAGFSRYLMRIDPLTGKEMWEQENDEPFWVLHRQIVDGQLIVSGEDRTVLVEAGTGERTHRLRGYPAQFAADVIYTADEDQLRAWDAESGDELWSLRLRTEDELASIGSMLVTADIERGQITRLR